MLTCIVWTMSLIVYATVNTFVFGCIPVVVDA